MTFQLKEEMLSAYQQLKALCLQLHRGVENNNKAAIQSESDFIHSCIEVGIIFSILCFYNYFVIHFHTFFQKI